MKKTIILFAFVCLVFSCTACNQTPDYSTEPWGEGVMIVKVSNKIKQQNIINIPSEIDGKRVYAIGKQVFECSPVEEVTLPDFLKEIGAEAFSNCENLKKIHFNQNLTKIDVYAFDKCTFLGDDGITFPSTLKHIAENAFFGCEFLNIKQISQVEYIGSGAFSGCDLSDYPLYIDNLNYLGINAFANSYLGIIEFKNVKKIDRAAFSNCSQLSEITILNEDAELNDMLFRDCYMLKPSGINIPDSILYRPGPLSEYPYLDDANIPDGTTVIPSRAYNNCITLYKVDIPSTVIEIEDSAFSDCFSLREITIPETVQVLGNHVFSRSENLETLRIEGDPSIAKCFLTKSEHPKLTVQCKENTQIKAYCEANSIPYEIIQ